MEGKVPVMVASCSEGQVTCLPGCPAVGWMGGIVVGSSRPGCVPAVSQGVSQLQESCNGRRNSRDAERKCEERPFKDILPQRGKAERESVYFMRRNRVGDSSSLKHLHTHPSLTLLSLVFLPTPRVGWGPGQDCNYGVYNREGPPPAGPGEGVGQPGGPRPSGCSCFSLLSP